MRFITYSMLGLFVLGLVFVAGDSISAPIFSPFGSYYVEYLKQYRGLPGAGGLLTGGYSSPAASRWVAGSTIMYSELKTPLGGYLAEIRDLVIDPANGRVSNVVITHIRMNGAQQISIPFSTVSKTGEAIFIHHAPEGVYPVSGQDPYRSEGLYICSKQQEPRESYRTSKLIGANARTSHGEALGQIDDLVIDSTDGHGYLVVSHNGKKVAVPLSVLSKGDENAFVLKTTKADLEASPAFTWSDMTKLQ